MISTRSLVLAVALAGCSQRVAPARAQALVFLDTDAPVPRLASRLRIRVVDASLNVRCATCTREIVLDGTEGALPVSFGIEPPTDGARIFIRATLYLGGRTSAGEPLPETAVDVVREVRFGAGLERQDVFLPFDCLGIRVDKEARTSCGSPIVVTDPHSSEVSRVGTWNASFSRDCASAPGDGEVCVRGGVFLMGDARVQGFGPFNDAVPEHAVALSPFFYDRFEFTVGRYRALRKAGLKGSLPAVGCPGSTGAACERCHWSDAAGDETAEARPLNCVTWQQAKSICEFEGKRLATEAEYEWAAGNREKEQLASWGDDPAKTCADGENPAAGKCLPGDGLIGTGQAAPVGKIALDTTIDGVHGLTGGVTEWLADAFAAYVEPCWTPGAYGPNPMCDSGTGTLRRARRGSCIGEIGSESYVISGRKHLLPSGASPFVGFRCARSE